MDNYKDYCCIDCGYCLSRFNFREGEYFVCTNENGRGCKDPYQVACEQLELREQGENT